MLLTCGLRGTLPRVSPPACAGRLVAGSQRGL